MPCFLLFLKGKTSPMKKLLYCFTLITLVGLLNACSGGTTVSEKNTKERYVCPMDTDVVSDHPDKCSKCGMDLEKES